MNRLMPRTVRLIPFSALIGMLVLFVLMIGPVDYYVLGFLRRRRFTWLLFPATSVGFMIATVLMANHYLGLRDQRTSLFVVDLAPDGTALRWNRYELTFAARDKPSVTELKDALWAPLEAQAMPFGFPGQTIVVPGPTGLIRRPNYSGGQYRIRGYPYGANMEREAGPPGYEGVLPLHFQTTESLRQWQPVLNRIFSFEPPPVPLLPNWRALEAAGTNLPVIRAKLSETKPFVGDLYVFSGTNSLATNAASAGILDPAILRELCVADTNGLLTLVAQVSPTGGGNFEDVPLLDPQSNDSVLAIVTRSGDDVVVYRRFFHGN
jgi:hypothetical protein